jgi:hypothetical protein
MRKFFPTQLESIVISEHVPKNSFGTVWKQGRPQSENKQSTDMTVDETLRKRHEDSDSDGEDEEEALEAIPEIDLDPSTLTPLSPEVISKQVRD